MRATEEKGGVTTLNPSGIVLIESRSLLRSCLESCLSVAFDGHVLAFADVASWLAVSDTQPASVVILCAAGGVSAAGMQRDIADLACAPNALPIVVVGDADDPEEIAGVIHLGAQGYIPTNSSLDIAIGAIRLVQAGGKFVPASILLAVRQTSTPAQDRAVDRLTARQHAVIEALRRGKPNKIIAYELNMCESTVKVHVRNIMRKLKAKNRTEIAFMTEHLTRPPQPAAIGKA